MGLKEPYKFARVCRYLLLFVLLLSVHNASSGQETTGTEQQESSALRLNDVTGIPWNETGSSPFFLKNPSNIQSSVFYDPDKKEYVIYQKVGSFDYRPPIHMSPEEYRKYEYKRAAQEYWEQRITGREESFRSNLIPQIEVGGEAFDKIFGSNTINIVPQGSAELVFGVNISHIDNNTLSEKLRTTTTFDFEEKIQMNVTGTIGDKMELGINYNTDALFDFENRVKLQYAGDEDEIFQKIEAGDVTLPLKGSLISGSYSLFGLKTEMKFGKLTVTSVLSQQKGESSVVQAVGGAQTQEFEIYATDYEANRHFFLSQYFRDTYDNSLKTLPTISSGINIEKIEVWVTNKTSSYDNSRNIVALMDLAESQDHIFNNVPEFQSASTSRIPDNGTNGMYQQLTATYGGIRDVDQVTNVLSGITPAFKIGLDYEKIENARKLNTTEYTLNKQLGYISLNIPLNTDEVLAVAYQYTLNGEVHQVGEFSTDGIDAPKTLVLKLIKGTTLSTKYPTWDLMMKNVYYLGSGQIDQSDFKMDILYEDAKSGNAINYLPEGNLHDKILLQVLGLDNLNSNNDWVSDGIFDFIDGITVMTSRGRVIFPVVEPFGSYLNSKIADPAIAKKYVFQELYDSTQTRAKQTAEKDKFIISGEFTSESGSEIYLNTMNIAQGSVVVSAGGVTLTENMDYTVDYNMGSVTIINPALLESQTPISVSVESEQYLGYQTKTLLGTHLNYRFSSDLELGATLLHLSEKPYTQKVVYGEEPISNTILGMDLSYKSDSRLLTSIVDKLPLVETKSPSSLSFFGEVAQLMPGQSKAIDDNAFIDDFESSETPLDLRSYTAWSIASIPQGQQKLFPEANLNNNLTSGFNRAKLAWYVIDPLFLRNGSITPDHIKRNADLQSSHFVREVYENEIFPNRESTTGFNTTITVFNLAYYPEEKGPYNFDTRSSTYSSGINSKGLLNDPSSRWGGIMREILTTDFETSNIQYVEFWLMDPFVENPDHVGGDFYINLGDVSEDVLKDSRKSFENGLPTSKNIVNVDTTSWGRVPSVQSVVDAFDNDSESRLYQDVGLDGMMNSDEQTFYVDYLQAAGEVLEPDVFNDIYDDPASDDFHYYRGSDYDVWEYGILERYKDFNGLEQNSPTSEMSNESYSTSGTTIPDMEDIDNDNTLNETEAYFQYRISMRPEDLVVGTNYIVDEIEYEATFANGEKSPVTWYQFKVPITEYEKSVGAISDFKSIRFMRMFLTDFDEPVIMRFAELNLVRAEWRKYNVSFFEGGERVTVPEVDDGSFEIGSVNIEDNSGKTPVNYVLPPGVDRVIDPTNTQLVQLNEQAMVLKVQDLADGDGRAAYKNMNIDMRKYRKLKMDVHAEALTGMTLDDGDLTVFVRIGSDYKNNFYEYEIPVKVTPPGFYNNNSEAQRLEVWPDENRFEIDLSVLQEVKQERNDVMREEGSSLGYTDVYSVVNGQGHRISVTGNPTLSNVKVMLVGVRNPIKTRGVDDDGLSQSGEIWVNELCLSDFNNEGGWAANAQLQARLADLATVDLAGQAITPGWGSIYSKVDERSMEQVMKYDVSSTVELGKLFPEGVVRLPVYLGYSETEAKPEYNPLDPDVYLDDVLDNIDNKSERDSMKNLTTELTQRKSINISNAGITKRGETPYPWDLANLSVNYTYNEIYNTNATTERDVEKTYKGSLNYNYEPNAKNIVPFKNVKLFNSPMLRIIKDFNFYLLPKNISYRTELFRYYNEVITRNISNPFLLVTPTYDKEFVMSRIFDLKYDITKQLKFDFTSTNLATIDEPFGAVDSKLYESDYDHWKDSVMVNLKNLGRTTNYNHYINVTYTLPINKIPFLSWINANARYSSDYSWEAGTLYPEGMGINIGNEIENSNDFSVTGTATLTTLYSKSALLKRIENNTKPGAAKQMKKELKTEVFALKNISLKAGTVRRISHNLGTEDVTLTITDGEGKVVEGKSEILNENRVNFTPDRDAQGVQVVVEGKVPVDRSPFIVAGEYFVRALMGVRSVNLTLTTSQGQYLPGYLPGTNYLGMSNYNDVIAPGLPFILGLSDDNFFDNAVARGWVTTDTLHTTAASSKNQINISARSSVEPFPGLKIDLTADRKFNKVSSAYFVADNFGNFPESRRNETLTGAFSMSVISWGTAFEKLSSEDGYSSAAFNRFKDNLEIISARRAQERMGYDSGYDPTIDPATGGVVGGPYKSGYSKTSSEVLIPSFLAAYTNTDPDKVTLEEFPSAFKMMPNWRITFDGLSKFEFIQRYFNSITLSHQYRSTYQIGSYATNLDYETSGGGFSTARDLQGNFVTHYEINTVTVSEHFTPLLNIDMNWKNSLSTRFEIRKSRTVSLVLTSNQITDNRVNEITFGAGYRFDDVSIILNTGGRQRALESDLNMNLDFSIKDNKAIARKLVEEVDQPVSGQTVFAAGLSADYILSDRFKLQLYIDHNFNDPFVATTYATYNTDFGFSIQFTLVQ